MQWFHNAESVIQESVSKGRKSERGRGGKRVKTGTEDEDDGEKDKDEDKDEMALQGAFGRFEMGDPSTRHRLVAGRLRR